VGGQGGRRIPEGCIARAVIRDGGVAAAMAEQSQQLRSSDCGQEQRQRLETLCIFLMCTILLPLMALLMHDPEIDESGLIGRECVPGVYAPASRQVPRGCPAAAGS
jgi:hypothetical protein